VDLRVEFSPGASAGESATLTCDPTGGTHPRAEAACTVLAEQPDALEPVPADAACTQIYGGDETAAVTGTLRGQPVDASFSRENGCEISRWDALDPLLRLTG
jgi:Subtilisin inhibitor-like